MDKVLIVDDDDLVRRAFVENLKDGGFSPLEASSGAEAIEIFREKPLPYVYLMISIVRVTAGYIV